MSDVQHFFPLTYNCVEDLKNDTSLKPEMVVRSLGYFQPSDGGGSYFKIYKRANMPKNFTVDDGKILQLKFDTTLYAVMITTDAPISVAAYGAVGDGVTDDYEAITRCLNSCDNVIFGQGKIYRIDSPITNLYHKTLNLNGAAITMGSNNQIFKLEEIDTAEGESSVIMNEMFMKSMIVNGSILIKDDSISLSESPITLNSCNYNLNFKNIVFGNVDSAVIRKESMPFLSLLIKESKKANVSFDGCTFINCGKIADVLSGGISFSNCICHDNYYGFEIYENPNNANVFTHISFTPFLDASDTHVQYAFRLNDDIEISNVTIVDVETPIVIYSADQINIESSEITWSDDYKIDQSATVYCIRFEILDSFDAMDIPINIENSSFTCTEDTDGLHAQFSNYECLICGNTNNTFSSITRYPIPNALSEVMKIRTNESPKIMSRYSEYAPTDSSMGMVRYRPYWGINRFASNTDTVFSDAGFSQSGNSNAVISKNISMEYSYEKTLNDVETPYTSTIHADVTAYMKTVSASNQCRTTVAITVDDSTPSIDPSHWYHVCFYVVRDIKDGSSGISLSIYTTEKSENTTTPAELHNRICNVETFDIPDLDEKLVRYDYLVQFTGSGSASTINTTIVYTPTKAQYYGVGQITFSEIDPTYCMSYNFEELQSIFDEFSNPIKESNSNDGGNINFVNVDNQNTTGFISKNLGLTSISAPYKRIVSVPWIYQSPYFKIPPYSYNNDQESEVEIQPIPNGIYVKRRGNAMVCGVNMISFSRQFNYDTTYYMNAEIKTSGTKMYDGSIMVLIDDILRYSWTPEEVSKKSFVVSSGMHDVRVFIPLAYNDPIMSLEMTIKNFFITESPDEEIYMVDVIPNMFYQLPLYKTGYIGVYPISTDQLPYTRGQIDVVYASGADAIETESVVVEDVVVGNATMYDDSLNMYGLNIQYGSKILPSVSIIPANVTDPTISWSSSNPSVVAIIDGYICSLFEGLSILTATCGSVSAKFYVRSQIFPISVAFTNLPESNAINLNHTWKPELTILPEDCSIGTGVTYTSTDDSVFSVDNTTGVITCVGGGVARIRATLSGTDVNNNPVYAETPDIQGCVLISSIMTSAGEGFITGEHVVDYIVDRQNPAVINIQMMPENTNQDKDITVSFETMDGTAKVVQYEVADDFGSIRIVTSGGGAIKLRVGSKVRPSVYTDVMIYSRIPTNGFTVLYNNDVTMPEINYTDEIATVYQVQPEDTTDRNIIFTSTFTGDGYENITYEQSGGIYGTTGVISASGPAANVNAGVSITKLYYTDTSYIEYETPEFSTNQSLTVHAFIEAITASISQTEFNDRQQIATLTVKPVPAFCTEWDPENYLTFKMANSSDADVVYIQSSGDDPDVYKVISVDNGTCTINIDYRGYRSNNHVYIVRGIDVSVDVTSDQYRAAVFANMVEAVATELNTLNMSVDASGSSLDIAFIGGLNYRASDVGATNYNYESASHVANLLEVSKRLDNRLDMIVSAGDPVYPIDQTESSTITINGAKEMTTTFKSVPGAIFDKIRPLANYLTGHNDRNDAINYTLGSSMSQVTISLEDLYKDRYLNGDTTADSGKGYWYKDFDKEFLRVIAINPHDREDWSETEAYSPLFESNSDYYRGFSTEQVNWFIQIALGQVPENYTVLVVSPYGLIEATAPNYTFGSGMNTDYFNADVMLNAINAYKAASTLSVNASNYARTGAYARYTLSNITKSYSSVGGGNIAVISSGVPYDFYVKNNNVFHVTVANSLGHNPSISEIQSFNTMKERYTLRGYDCGGDIYNRLANETLGVQYSTYIEDTFDIIHYESKSQALRLIRFGAGATESSDGTLAPMVRTFTFDKAFKGVPTESITVDPSELSFISPLEKSVAVTVQPSNATDLVLYSIDNNSVATVDSNGVVTPVETGNAILTVQSGDKVATCKISVAYNNTTANDVLNTMTAGFDFGNTFDTVIGESTDFRKVDDTIINSLSKSGFDYVRLVCEFGESSWMSDQDISAATASVAMLADVEDDDDSAYTEVEEGEVSGTIDAGAKDNEEPATYELSKWAYPDYFVNNGGNASTEMSFTIKDSWLTRIDEIRQLCTKHGMRLILCVSSKISAYDKTLGYNETGQIYYAGCNNTIKNYTNLFLTNVWSQLASRFSEVSPNELIFEVIDNPCNRSSVYTGGIYECATDDVTGLTTDNQISEEVASTLLTYLRSAKKAIHDENKDRLILYPTYANTTLENWINLIYENMVGGTTQGQINSSVSGIAVKFFNPENICMPGGEDGATFNATNITLVGDGSADDAYVPGVNYAMTALTNARYKNMPIIITDASVIMDTTKVNEDNRHAWANYINENVIHHLGIPVTLYDNGAGVTHENGDYGIMNRNAATFADITLVNTITSDE